MKRTIEISDETWKKIKDQVEEGEAKEIDNYEDMVGNSYFFRTLTYHLIGTIRKKVGLFFVLDDASWVADSGRFMQAIQKGKLDEVEPTCNGHMINIEACVDIIPWKHNNPKGQK